MFALGFALGISSGIIFSLPGNSKFIYPLFFRENKNRKLMIRKQLKIILSAKKFTMVAMLEKTRIVN